MIINIKHSKIIILIFLIRSLSSENGTFTIIIDSNLFNSTTGEDFEIKLKTSNNKIDIIKIFVILLSFICYSLYYRNHMLENLKYLLRGVVFFLLYAALCHKIAFINYSA